MISAALMAQRRGGGAKRGAVIRSTTIPAPIGGLNARDSIAEMKATDALVLDNYVPDTTNIRLRPGYRKFVTGITGTVETLLPYRSGTGNRMFAGAGGSIYDATALGAAGAPVKSGLTNSRFEHVNFGTPGGQFLLAVNGADPLQRFDGTTWTDATQAPAITGFDTTRAIAINVFGKRVWLIEQNSFRVWYLPLQSIGGAASELDLSSLFLLGGSLAGMITWTVAGTTATTQYAAFISTEGEVNIYEGYDPTNAATWSLTGQARIGRPIGRRFWTRVGTDVVMITTDGFVPLSEALQFDRKNTTDAVSDKIKRAANDAIASYSGNFGWQVTLFTSGSRLFFNVPLSDGSSFQYVMNTNTAAWCRYLGLNASCWETTQDSLFFGGVGVVYQAEYGEDDNGIAISGEMVPAFNYFGRNAQNKRFTQAQVIVEAPASFTVTIDLLTNFDQASQSSTVPLISGNGGAPWNTSPWNTTPWGASSRVGYGWQWVGGIGFVATSRIRTTTKGVALAIDAISYTYEVGGLY